MTEVTVEGVVPVKTVVFVFTTRRVRIARTMPWQDVSLSDCPSVCHTPVFCLNSYSLKVFFTVAGSAVTVHLSAGAAAGFQARVGKNLAQSAEKIFSFAHPGFQFAHPAIRNGCPPCPPYRCGFKGKGLVGY